MKKIDSIFRYEYEKYVPILKNTTHEGFSKKKVPNEPWQIKGFGSRFGFDAWITNFGQNIMYPYAKQKGMANMRISISPHGSGFSNSRQHYEVLPGTHTRLSETIYYVEGKDSSLRYYMNSLGVI